MPQTILVLMFGDLGDTLLTVPALRAVRRHYPESTLLVMAKSSPGSYVRALGLADDVIDVDKHALDRLRDLSSPVTAIRLLRLCYGLRRRRIDQLIVFQHLTTVWGSLKYGLVSYASGAPLRAGLDNGRGWFLTHRVRDRGFGAVHESEYWLRVAALVGADGRAVLEAASSDDDARAGETLLGARRARFRSIARHSPWSWLVRSRTTVGCRPFRAGCRSHARAESGNYRSGWYRK